MNEGIGAWLFDILILPGEAVLYLLLTYAPGVAEFLGLGRDESGGTFSITIAVLLWLTAIIVAGTALSKVREIDRRLTSHVAAAFQEFVRLLRILRRRVVTTIANRRQARAEENDLVVATIDLEGYETAVLRCLSNIDDGAVLTTEEIAAKLDRSAREIRSILRRLVELEMIKPGSDSFSQKDGHRIATAGQMYLLGI